MMTPDEQVQAIVRSLDTIRMMMFWVGGVLIVCTFWLSMALAGIGQAIEKRGEK